MAAFNHAFADATEPFVSLLEDDNWWDPEFLQCMMNLLEGHREAMLAWANMRIWQEQPDGQWQNTGGTIWPQSFGEETTTFAFPTLLQLDAALHSNGAMIFRTAGSARAVVPMTTPFVFIEPIRERALAGPMILVHRPLANFAATQTTARANGLQQWLDGQLLLAASFLERIPLTPKAYAKLWHVRRATNPRSTNLLLLLALLGIQPKSLRRDAQLRDWYYFVRSIVRHPIVHARCLNFRQRNRGLWDYLVSQTDARMRDAESNGFEALDGDSIALKSELSGAP